MHTLNCFLVCLIAVAISTAGLSMNKENVVFDETAKMYTDLRFPEYLFSYRPVLIFDCHKAGYEFVREPVLRRMPDGSLFCLHYTGGETEPMNENLMLGTSSTDEGETWSEARVLFKHLERGVYAPELFVEDGTPTIFLHTFSDISHYLEMRTYLSKSSDSGKTWSEPVSVPGVPLATLIRKGIVLSDGAYLFPHYWIEQIENSNWTWTNRNANYYNRPVMRNWIERCGVIRSTDHGETYTPYGYICAWDGITPVTIKGEIREEKNDVRIIEPAVIELEPGHVLMLLRADGQNDFYKSESFDGGITWSPAEAGNIPAVASKVVLLKYKDSVIMLFNSKSPGASGDGLNTRHRLSAWISNDKCKTWTKKVELASVKAGTPEKWKAVCYPDGFIDEAKGLLYCTIDNYRQAFLLKIPLDDLLKK